MDQRVLAAALVCCTASGAAEVDISELTELTQDKSSCSQLVATLVQRQDRAVAQTEETPFAAGTFYASFDLEGVDTRLGDGVMYAIGLPDGSRAAPVRFQISPDQATQTRLRRGSKYCAFGLQTDPQHVMVAKILRHG